MQMSRWGSACGLLLLASLVATAQKKITVTRVEGGPLDTAFVGVAKNGDIKVRGAGDEVLSLPQEKLVSVAFSNSPVVPAKGTVALELTSGDRLICVVEGGDFDEMKVSSISAGSMGVLLDYVACVTYLDHVGSGTELPPLADDAVDDVLFLRAGDGLDPLPGEVQRLARTGVVFTSDAGKDRLFSFIKDRVVAVRFAATDEYKEPEGLLCVVGFRDGGQLTGVLTGNEGGALLLKLTVGPTVTLDRRLIRSLAFKNAAFRYLSELAPKEHAEVPFLEGGPTFGVVRDRGFGREEHLAIGTRKYHKGVGLHARSTCKWDLGGRYAVFKAEVGVDPLTRNRAVPGSVVMRVLADGQEVWKSGQLVSGDDPVQVLVKGLGGKRELVIEVDFASSLGTGARAVLGNAMLLRK